MSEVTKGEWWIQVWNEGTRYESVHINPPLGGNDAHAVATLSGPDAKANARHIVHCVNNHERLVEALQNTLRVLDGEDGTYSINRDRKLLAQIQSEKGGKL